MRMQIDERLIVRETKNLRLCLPSEEHLSAWASWLADFETVRYILETPSTREDSWRVLAMCVGHWSLRGFGLWTIIEKSTGNIVGRGGLWQPEGWPGVEFSILIGADSRQSGYAAEVAEEALACGFEILGLNEIWGVVTPWNTRCLKLVERFQFTFRREWRILPHAMVNIYSLTKEDFRRIRGLNV
jgi:RimJ/RimL family protein N-acetyltransferase